MGDLRLGPDLERRNDAGDSRPRGESRCIPRADDASVVEDKIRPPGSVRMGAAGTRGTLAIQAGAARTAIIARYSLADVPRVSYAVMSETTVPSDVGGNPAKRSLNVFRSIVRALNINSRAIELRTGLSLAQVFVLQELDKRPSETMGELAERTATHPSSVSVVARRLTERGLATFEVDRADRRRRRLQITDVGRDVVLRAPATIQSQLIGGFGTLEPENGERLARLLEQWVTASGVDMRAPPMLLEDEQP